MTKEEGVFFVKIRDPVEMRRSILETAKESIEVLQFFEKFKNIREEKLKKVDELKGTLREITRLTSKLKRALPKAKLRVKLHEHDSEAASVKPKKQKKSKKKASAKKTAGMQAPRSEIDKLEQELNAIESKLSSIS